MIKIKFFLIFIVFLSLNSHVLGDLVEIKVKVQNKIITNLDIENEKRYLFFLNPKLRELEKIRIQNIAIESLITDIIKKKELEKSVTLPQHVSPSHLLLFISSPSCLLPSFGWM